MLCDVAETIEARLEDGWQWVSDSLAIGTALLPVIRFVPKIKELYDTFMELDDEQYEQLIQHFKDEFDLSNDEAEEMVENVVGFVDEAMELVKLALAIYPKLRGR